MWDIYELENLPNQSVQFCIDNQLLIPLGSYEWHKESLAMEGRGWTFIYLSTSPGTLRSVLTMKYRKTGKAWYQRSCKYHVNIRWILNDIALR